MRLELAGKTALITGSSRGIGRAIAETLHGEDCRVAINGRNVGDLALVVSKLPGAIAVSGDVTRPAEAKAIIAETVEAFGHLDVLVCNVGSGRSVAPGDENYEEWQKTFALNLWSATNMVEAARDALVDSKGCIICISSICGLEVIEGAPVTYSAAKAALNAYVRGIARPLGKYGVRINAVAPGNINFDGSLWAHKLAEDPINVQAMLNKNVPLRRLGTDKEVASLVAFLASPLAAFATGTTWTLDGGQMHV